MFDARLSFSWELEALFEKSVSEHLFILLVHVVLILKRLDIPILIHHLELSMAQKCRQAS
jgi:hypothetical protein